MTEKYLTYSGYLKLDQLLSIQEERSAPGPGEEPEHDEMLFIIIHQVYELWFKQMLHELDYVSRLLGQDALAPALHSLKRVLTILKVLVHQIDILETMTPLEFLAFRQRLEEASGLESYQFREVEFVLGFKRPSALPRYPEGSEPRARLERRFAEPTLWDAFVAFLARRGLDVSDDVLNRDFRERIEASPELQTVLIDVYRNHPSLVPLCERLIDMDEGIQEWRYRHVKMVQRTIGTKQGTGGTAGAEYLARTLMTPMFPDLWDIRTQL